MATKKKKKTGTKKLKPRVRVAKRKQSKKLSTRTFVTPRQELLATEPRPARLGIDKLAIVVLVVLGIGMAFQRWQRNQALTPTQVAPPGRDIAPADAKAAPAAAAPAPSSAPIRRETASPSARTWRASKGPLVLRAWRSTGQTAEASIFRKGKPALIKLVSDAGTAGYVDLRWDGKDAQGKPAAEGLYYVRLSGQGSWGVELFRLQR